MRTGFDAPYLELSLKQQFYKMKDNDIYIVTM